MLIRIGKTTKPLEFNERIKTQKASGRIPIIAEIKAYTPRSGDLLKGRSLASIAHQYDAADAACLSVVTGKWFGGTVGMLSELAQHTKLPILRKDFITNRRQILQSLADGASAVLLTKKFLTTNHLIDLSEYALSIGVAPFVEVADEIEVQNLNLPHGAIIAVNNKHILNQETDCGDINQSLKLADACRATGAGILASASGLCIPEQTQQLFNAGFDAFLIGTALLESNYIQNRLEQFSYRRELTA